MIQLIDGVFFLKKIILCDYIGATEGHSLKVLKETAILLKRSGITPIICAPSIYRDYFKRYKFIALPFCICRRYESNKLKKIFLKLSNGVKYFINFAKVFSFKEVIWFTTVSLHLFLYLFLVCKNKHKIITTLYIQNYKYQYKSKILDYMFRKSLSKVTYIVSTNDNLKFPNKTIYIKDYYFTDYYKELLKKYEHVKKRQIVCLGVVDEKKKDLVNLIKVAENLNIKVIIVGYFFDMDYFARISKLNRSSNVIIKNENLSEEKYYKLLAESEFAILPYHLEQYKNKTSGVLQECVFLNTIPIAPRELLSFNGIDGIGYNNICELSILYYEKINIGMYRRKYNILKETIFSESLFSEKIKKIMLEI